MFSNYLLLDVFLEVRVEFALVAGHLVALNLLDLAGLVVLLGQFENLLFVSKIENRLKLMKTRRRP